ncbi:MAG: tetratricopeptide repeat protein [Desulfosarcina sp.]
MDGQSVQIGWRRFTAVDHGRRQQGCGLTSDGLWIALHVIWMVIIISSQLKNRTFRKVVNMKTLAMTLSFIFLWVGISAAAGSSSVTPSVSKDVKYYNQGVKLMMDKNFSKAEKQFRKALDRNERFAEAHNNLAYTLRKQGSDNFAEALKHYNRAIALNPNLPEPYMYRGVLHIQMGNKNLAMDDHSKLVSMGSPLAEELQYVVENGREKEPEQFFGVSRKVKK